jgi:hypothetical protein
MNSRNLWTLLLPLVAACGGGDSTSVDKTQFGAAFAKAYCTQLFACCAGTSGALTEPTCESRLGAATQTQLDLALAKSTQTYHADSAGDCIAQFNSSNCGAVVVGSASASCNGIVTGNVALGGACTNTTDCVNGGFCVTSGSSTTGVCTAQVPVGGACFQVHNGGFTGNACAGNGHLSTALASDAGCVCEAPRANGAACGNSFTNGLDNECASDYCGANSTCVPLTAIPAGYCSLLLTP